MHCISMQCSNANRSPMSHINNCHGKFTSFYNCAGFILELNKLRELKSEGRLADMPNVKFETTEKCDPRTMRFDWFYRTFFSEVVTGSTDGIGRQYAKELASQGMNIVLISRTEKKLIEVAQEIGNHCPANRPIIRKQAFSDEFADGPERISGFFSTNICSPHTTNRVNVLGQSEIHRRRFWQWQIHLRRHTAATAATRRWRAH